MDNQFSEGFMHDLGKLLEMCCMANTDNLEVDFTINGNRLKVKFVFSIPEDGEQDGQAIQKQMGRS